MFINSTEQCGVYFHVNKLMFVNSTEQSGLYFHVK